MLMGTGFKRGTRTSGTAVATTTAPRSRGRAWTRAIAPLVMALLALAVPASPARAASSVWGAQLGTYNGEGVYSNGSVSTYLGPDVGEGPQYQCVELIQRYFHDKYGTVSRWPNVPTAASMFSVASLPAGLSRYANGSAMRPSAGDALVFAAIAGWSSGHVALITAVSGTAVSFVQQNLVWAGVDVWSDTLAIDGSNRVGNQSTRVTYPPVLGWIHVGATAVASTMTSPAAGSQFGGSNVTFTWTSGTSVSARWLYVGTSSGGADLYNSNQLGAPTTSLTVPGLPTDGRTVYVRLWSLLPSGWNLIDYTYRAAQAAAQVPAAPSKVVVTVTSPTNIHVTWSDNATNETGYRVTNNINTVLLGANASSFDWPTNPSTYQCLAVQAYNSAGSSSWTTWACTTTPAATASYGDVIVDDQSAGFVRAGTASYWHEYAGGFNGHFWWTNTNTSGVDDRATWTPNLPAAGRWEVYTFVPSPYGTTTNARYRVDHQGISTTVSINQNSYSNVWLSLGTYAFTADSSTHVFMGDETYEASSRYIAFDAMKWVWRGN